MEADFDGYPRNCLRRELTSGMLRRPERAELEFAMLLFMVPDEVFRHARLMALLAARI